MKQNEETMDSYQTWPVDMWKQMRENNESKPDVQIFCECFGLTNIKAVQSSKG